MRINCVSVINKNISFGRAEQTNPRSNDMSYPLENYYGGNPKTPTAENYAVYCNITPTNYELEKNLMAAKDAVKYVKDMNLKSSTQMEHENPFIMYSPTNDYKEIQESISFINNSRRKLSINDYVEKTLQLVPAMGVGNCSDQAILAANYLMMANGIDNIALIACTMKGQNPLSPESTDQHVFTVIGLDKNADLTDPTTWGENSVIVDPWGNIAAPTDSSDPSQSGLNRLFAKFRTKFMTFDNYAKYINPTNDTASMYNWTNNNYKNN